MGATLPVAVDLAVWLQRRPGLSLSPTTDTVQLVDDYEPLVEVSE